jgi:nicotinamide-nucleotide amidase
MFLAGWVTYSNQSKTRQLGVPSSLLEEFGAVSEPVARAMAEGARRESGADYAISVTGIAGPGGGSEEKPVGTVFIGVSGPQGTTVQKQLNRFDRLTFKFQTGQQAFNQLRRQLLQDQGQA